MERPGDIVIREMTNRSLEASIRSRAGLSKKEVICYGTSPNTAGLLFSNFANMILNRMIDLFDDVLFLLENNRIPSACVAAATTILHRAS